VKDPIGALGWPLEKGRDGERTPMQWISGTNTGFTTGRPWLPNATIGEDAQPTDRKQGAGLLLSGCTSRNS